MKWFILILFILFFIQAGVSVYMDGKLYERLVNVEICIADQFNYSDSLLLIYDSDTGLAWAKVAEDAHTSRSVIGQWIAKGPWREGMLRQESAIRQNHGYCIFLHTKLDSLIRTIK